MSQTIPDKMPQLGISDQIPEDLHPLLEAIVRQRKRIIIGVAVALVLVFCFGAWRWFDSHSTNAASTRLGEILTQSQGAERVEQLTAFLADSPGHLATSARIELAAALMDQGQFVEASEAFDALIQSKDPDVKTLAQLGKGRCLVLAGKPGDARTLLDDLRTSAPKAYQLAVKQLFAMAAEQSGDHEAAITVYQDLSAVSPQQAEFLKFKITQLSGTK